jgi:hypothetical protein
VVIRAGGVDIPITGVNVVARRINRGAYPPPAGIEAFPGFPGTQIQLDPDGVPLEPPVQNLTDPLATATSAVTGLEFGTGRYRIDGLPPGDYLIEVQQINPVALGGSSIGPLGTQLPIPVLEFYNGPRESGDSSDSPTDFQPLTVTPGTVISGVDIILNGISSAAATLVSEREPNDKKGKAQRITLPAEINGRAAFDDPSVLRMDFPDQDPDKIEDLFRFTLDVEKVVYIIVEPVGGTDTSDLDMYIFDSSLKKKKVSFDSATVRGLSAGPSANELIGMSLQAGTYYIGLSAFGSTSRTNVQYRLFALAAQ